MVKNLPAMQEDPGAIPGLERSSGGGHGNPLQHSCLENPIEESGGLQSMGSQKVRHNWSNLACTHGTLFKRFYEYHNLTLLNISQPFLRTWVTEASGALRCDCHVPDTKPCWQLRWYAVQVCFEQDPCPLSVFVLISNLPPFSELPFPNWRLEAISPSSELLNQGKVSTLKEELPSFPGIKTLSFSADRKSGV